MSDRAGADAPLVLAPHCFLKRLETPALYDVRADALYELDEAGFQFLVTGPTRAAAGLTPETAAFVDFCLAEGLLVPAVAAAAPPAAAAVPAEPPLVPSLRYLIVHLTDRCTLRCRHCFIGPQTGTDLPLPDVLRTADEFAALQGLRFIVSGGEPLLHRHFWRLNERLPSYPFRGGPGRPCSTFARLC
ncbi:MAG TPA: radical SAM protein [Candidatus Methanoperedens sp.]|nr:radical SAM protein [Candidatus Methanoperedens sp.]